MGRPGGQRDRRPDGGDHARRRWSRRAAARCAGTRAGRRRSRTTGRWSASPARTRRARPTTTASSASTTATSRWPGPATSPPASSHVDPDLSPFEPPAAEAIAGLNARMLIRAADRASSRERWQIGAPYADEPVATVVVASGRPLGLARAAVPAVFDDAAAAGAAAGQPAGARHGRVTRALLAGVVARAWSHRPASPRRDRGAGIRELRGHGGGDGGRAARGRAGQPGGARPSGSSRSRTGSTGRGSPTCRPPSPRRSPRRSMRSSRRCAHPRYIVPRLFVAPPADKRAARRLARGTVPRDTGPRDTAWPTACPPRSSTTRCPRRSAETPGWPGPSPRAWNARVSPGEMLYTGSPEGAGILVAQRGDDPFDVTTQIRTLWR